MSNKEKDKERNKEKDKEIQQHQQHAKPWVYPKPRVVRSCYSVVCFGEIKASAVYDAAERIGMTIEEVNCWMDFMDEVGWRFKDGTQVTKNTFARSLRMWHKVQPKIVAETISRLHKTQRLAQMGCDFEEMERIKKSIAEKKLKAALSEPNAWELCDERCANFCADGCPKCKHWSIPPQLRERPIPPEQCLHFKAKGGRA